MSTHANAVKKAAVKRPFGVILICVLLLVQGLVLVALAAAVTLRTAVPGASHFQPPLIVDFAGLTASDRLSALLVGALGVFIVISGIGVVRLRPWAWLAAMALQGWTLAVFLLGYFTQGQRSYPTVLFSVVTVFYLNSRTVRQTFDLVRNRQAASPLGPLAAPRAGMGAKPDVTSRGTGSS